MKEYTKWNIFSESSDKFRVLIPFLLEKIHQFFYRFKTHNGVKVVEEEWDYLIILDACRYDIFKEVNDIRGNLEKRISQGSNTSTWLKRNFSGYYDNIVYVSSHPRVSNAKVKEFKATDHFFKVESVWDYGWDEQLGTVPPEEVTKAALKAKEKYPNKRLIIHYMQPHGPWIGQNGVLKWPMVQLGELNLKEAKKAYRNNLKLVISKVKKLIKKLNGKIVISSDHGEHLGEKFLLSHAPNLYSKELVEIPWLEVG